MTSVSVLSVCLCLLCGQAKYKFRAKELLKSGCNELLRPDILNAIYNSSMWSKVTICLRAIPRPPRNLMPPFSTPNSTVCGLMLSPSLLKASLSHLSHHHCFLIIHMLYQVWDGGLCWRKQHSIWIFILHRSMYGLYNDFLPVLAVTLYCQLFLKCYINV